MRYFVVFSLIFNFGFFIVFYKDNGLYDFPIKKIDCLSWNPYRDFTKEPSFDKKLPLDHIKNDLIQIRETSKCVRTYSSTGSMEEAVAFGKKIGLEFILGIQISKNKKHSKLEVNKAIEIANKNPNVVSVIVGNENISKLTFNTFDAMIPREIIKYIRQVKQSVKQPVSIAELPDAWLETPRLFREVDYIAVNLLPFWYSISAEKSHQWVLDTLKRIKTAYPDKDIFISEIGWPTYGTNYEGSEAIVTNQFYFFKHLHKTLSSAGGTIKNQLGYRYNLIEAFDQPWKSVLYEGRVGAHWGIYRADGASKYSMQRQNSKNKGLMLACLIGFLVSLIIMLTKKYKRVGSIFWSAFGFQSAAVVLCLTYYNAVDNYELYNYSNIPMFFVIILPVFVSILYMKECVDIIDKQDDKNDAPKTTKDAYSQPLVSIHLACCNEPVELVTKNLQSLLDMDYKNFEIIVVDNNTTDEQISQGIRAFCEKHQDHIKFFHLKKHPGYKAGALNFALEQTSPKAEFVAVIDADYVVHPAWIQENITVFADDEVVVAQCPQNYAESPRWLESALRDEYAGFFNIGMVLRDRANALIMHGTLVILRASFLRKIKWNPKSICEDAYLGLELLKQGKVIKYNNKNFGQGVIPVNMNSYMKQRFRWVYGGLRILYGSLFEILGIKKSNLSLKARYYFLAGWLPWLLESLYIIFCIVALYIGYNIFEHPRMTPSTSLLAPIFYLLFIRSISTVLTYSVILKKNLREIMLAFLAGSSLTFSISFAALLSIFYPYYGFERTSKTNSNILQRSSTVNRFINKIITSKIDIVISLLLFGLALALTQKYQLKIFEINCWTACLLVLAVPGLSHLTLWVLQLSKDKV